MKTNQVMSQAPWRNPVLPLVTHQLSNPHPNPQSQTLQTHPYTKLRIVATSTDTTMATVVIINVARAIATIFATAVIAVTVIANAVATDVNTILI